MKKHPCDNTPANVRERRLDRGPPGPPVRTMLLGLCILVLVAMLYGCATRDPIYGAPPPKPCPIPVYDGAKEEGRLIGCIYPEDTRAAPL